MHVRHWEYLYANDDNINIIIVKKVWSGPNIYIYIYIIIYIYSLLNPVSWTHKIIHNYYHRTVDYSSIYSYRYQS